MYSSDSKIKDFTLEGKKECYTLVIAAAGSGKRMGLTQKKQFLQYKGRSLYMNSVLIGENSDIIDEIIIVTSEEEVEYVKAECIANNLEKLKIVISGGKERQDSIYNALQYCKDGIVAIHDGARPFLEESYLIEGLNTILEERNISGVVVGVKVKDTIKKVVENGLVIEETPKRETLYAAQTPQIFKTDLLKSAYEKAKEDKYYGTDDSSLVERCGGIVKIIEGSYNNIKVTTIEDLKYLSKE